MLRPDEHVERTIIGGYGRSRCGRVCAAGFFKRHGVRPGPHSGHHGVSQHDQRDVTVPAMPGSGLVVVEAEFVLGGLEALFNTPARALDMHQCLERRFLRAPGREIRQIAIGGIVPRQQPTGPGLVRQGLDDFARLAGPADVRTPGMKPVIGVDAKDQACPRGAKPFPVPQRHRRCRRTPTGTAHRPQAPGRSSRWPETVCWQTGHRPAHGPPPAAQAFQSRLSADTKPGREMRASCPRHRQRIRRSDNW